MRLKIKKYLLKIFAYLFISASVTLKIYFLMKTDNGKRVVIHLLGNIIIIRGFPSYFWEL